VPLLEESGLGTEQIQTILVENPRRVLTGEA
jgi:predicted metal-dependent phosphotriesterase family hydrolase